MQIFLNSYQLLALLRIPSNPIVAMPCLFPGKLLSLHQQEVKPESFLLTGNIATIQLLCLDFLVTYDAAFTAPSFS